jgi:hypothetical protein
VLEFGIIAMFARAAGAEVHLLTGTVLRVDGGMTSLRL